jgi:hypothetical protein
VIFFLKIGTGSGLTRVKQTAPCRSRGVDTIHDFLCFLIVSEIFLFGWSKNKNVLHISILYVHALPINRKNDPRSRAVGRDDQG